MSMMTQRYQLDLRPGGKPVRVPCTQGDSKSRAIGFTLTNGAERFTAPESAVMTIDGTKPDGTSFSYQGTVSGSSGSFTIRDQMTAAAGDVACQLTITNGGEVLGSSSFILDVQENAIPASLAMSQTVMESFQAMKNAAATSASEALASANAAAASAEKAGAYHNWGIPHGAWTRYDTQVSTNVLAIALGENNTLDAVKNQPATIMVEDASTLTNSPVTSGGFWARRTVYPVSNPTGSEHITVELEEYEPVLGRRWLRTYYAATGKWSSAWVEINPTLAVASEGTSGAWRYRIWKNGFKECWLCTSLKHEVKQQSGSLYYSSTVEYPYPISFTEKPTLYIGVRSPNNKPIWGIPSTPASGSDVKNNAYIELLAGTSTDSISTDIYAYACGM